MSLLYFPCLSELMASPSKLKIFICNSSRFFTIDLHLLTKLLILPFKNILILWSLLPSIWLSSHPHSALTDPVSKLFGGVLFSFPSSQSILCSGINALLSDLVNFLLKLSSEQSPTEHYSTIWALTCCFSFNSCHPSTWFLPVPWAWALLIFQFSKQMELFYVSPPLHMLFILLYKLLLFLCGVGRAPIPDLA